jgi:hypothetical protein
MSMLCPRCFSASVEVVNVHYFYCKKCGQVFDESERVTEEYARQFLVQNERVNNLLCPNCYRSVEVRDSDSPSSITNPRYYCSYCHMHVLIPQTLDGALALKETVKSWDFVPRCICGHERKEHSGSILSDEKYSWQCTEMVCHCPKFMEVKNVSFN